VNLWPRVRPKARKRIFALTIQDETELAKLGFVKADNGVFIKSNLIFMDTEESKGQLKIYSTTKFDNNVFETLYDLIKEGIVKERET
jgi:hypothetical protein